MRELGVECTYTKFQKDISVSDDLNQYVAKRYDFFNDIFELSTQRKKLMTWLEPWGNSEPEALGLILKY